MKKLLILCLLLPLMAQSNNDYLNKKFPTIQGISLSNNEVIFPDVLDGRPAVLAIAFRQRAQKCINTWAGDLLKMYGLNQSVQYYEIPMLGGQWTTMRGWIDGGMRGGVPKPLHDFTVTYYGPLKRYHKLLGTRGNGDCYIYILDKKGVVKERFNGYATASAMQEMFKLIDSLK